MSGVQARCTNCDHVWQTRKPPEEIDRPRCSECKAHGDDVVFDPGEDSPPPEIDAVEAARRKRRRYELLDRIDALLDRLERTGPSDTYHEVASEVRGEYRELWDLGEHLDFADELSFEELDSIEARVDELADSVEDHAETLVRIDQLSATVEELEAQKADLEAAIEELRRERDEYEDVLSRI